MNKFDELTQIGEKVAQAYEDNIKNTDYFKKFITAEEIPIHVLKEYGTKACICALKKKTLEREALKEIFFSVNHQTLTLES